MLVVVIEVVKEYLESLPENKELSSDEVKEVINELVYWVNYLLDLEYNREVYEYDGGD